MSNWCFRLAHLRVFQSNLFSFCKLHFIYLSFLFHLVDANIQYFEELLTLFFRTRTLCPLHLISVFLSLDILSLQACPAPKIPRIPRQGGSRWQEEGFHLPLGNCLLMSVICNSRMDWDGFTFLSAFVAKLGQAGKKSAWHSCSWEEIFRTTLCSGFRICVSWRRTIWSVHNMGRAAPLPS